MEWLDRSTTLFGVCEFIDERIGILLFFLIIIILLFVVVLLLNSNKARLCN
ncbi:Uncharacterised protein [Yersinia enterocolitica]|nr:Uncharacterised protein [Yersinia enterocolitica]